jgi:hypothetical protein
MMGFFGSAADDATATATDEPDATPHRQRKLYTEPDELNDHLSGLFQGKIGTFAKELAENISEDFQSLLAKIFETSTPKDIMFNLMKNPNKISGLCKTVTSKLQEKNPAKSPTRNS